MDRPRRSQRVLGTDTPLDSSRGGSQLPDTHRRGGGGGGGPSSSTIDSSSGSQAKRERRLKPYHVVQPNVPLGGSWPLSRSSAPLRPGTPIGPGQAQFSTFASKMKLGVSTLMQPLPPQGDFSDPVYGRGGHSELAPLPGVTRSGRSTKTTRYYEEEEDDDDDEDGEGSDDEMNMLRPTGSRGGSRLGGRGTPQQHQASPRPPMGEAPPAPELPGQRLGQAPPSNRILVRRARKTPHVYYSESDAARAAEHREALVPIKIDLEVDNYRIKDHFVWNLQERLVGVSDFIRVFLQDLDLPMEPYAHQLEASIHQQIEEWTALAEIDVSPAKGGVWANRDPEDERKRRRRGEGEQQRPEAKGKDARSWRWGIDEEFKKHMRETKGGVKRRRIEGAAGEEEYIEGQDGEWEDDMRVIVNYDVQILHHSLRDRLEWDLSSPLTPEAFAAQLGKDLSLSGEALPLISAALREALLNHKRAVGELGLIGMGEMWGKAQREEDEARRDLEEERRERKRRREERKMLAQGLVPPPPAATGGEAGQEASSPSRPPRVSIAATPASAASPPIEYASDDEDEADISGNTAAAEAAAKALLPASERLAQALATKSDLVARGPRQLVGAWRDWFESKEFGPLLEYLGDAEIERRETEGLRALRRNRREAARGGGGGGGDGGAGPVPERYRPR